MLSVSLLGDFCIRHDEVPVTGVDTPRLQSLLAYLLLHRDAPQSRAHLAFLFWPDTTEAQARTNLRYLLHHLRHALPDADSYLETGVQTLQWRSGAPFSLDLADFDAALAQAERAARANDPAAIRDALERAAALYKGDLLPSCYDDWIIPERERLREAYLGALERLVHLLENQRDYQAAIGNAQRLLRHDSLHEATYRRLIRLYALNGDRAGALRAYHTCATVLRRELDVAPSAPTREAYEQLLGAGSALSPALPTPSASSPLVGREKEWAQMLQAWRGVTAGNGPHVVMVCGEAGIGKTRLAEELLLWAARQGITTANAHCYAAEGPLAYAPVTAWLRAQPLAPLEDVWLAEVARRVYANEEAIALFRRGLALLEDGGQGVGKNERSCQVAVRLWEGLGDLLELKAAHEEALQAYQNALARVPRADRISQARLHRKTGVVLREQMLYVEALDACRRAEIALGEQPGEAAGAYTGAWWAEWIEAQVDEVWAHYWLARWPEMEELVNKVRPIMQKLGGAASRAQFLMAATLMALRKNRYVISDEMLADQREGLAAGRECGAPKIITDCGFELGFLHLWRRELEAAEEHLQAALELAETSGDARMRTLCLTYLTVLCRFRGQADGVLSYALRSQEAAEAAHMPAYVAAAKGNQAWLAWHNGDLAAAEQLSREALAIWQQSPLVYPFQWQALWPLIAVVLAQGHEEEAWAHVQALLEPKQQRLPDGLNASLEAAVQAQAEGRGR